MIHVQQRFQIHLFISVVFFSLDTVMNCAGVIMPKLCYTADARAAFLSHLALKLGRLFLKKASKRERVC